MKIRSNADVIRALQSKNEKEEEAALTHLYEASQQTVKRFVLQNKGSQEDADDIFHDGLVAFYNLVKQHKLDTTTNVEAYLFSICRNMWRKRLTKRPVQTAIEENLHDIPSVDIEVNTLLEGDRKHLIEKILQQLGQECYQLLISFYYDRLRMKEIVDRMNLSNEQVARNKKLSCMKKLRTMVLDSPLYRDLLT